MGNLANALQQLRAERREAQSHLEKLDQAIAVIESLNGTGTPQKANQPTRVISAPVRVISQASRRKMALAQQARWARAKEASQPVVVGSAKTTGSAPAKRTMSASARRKIAAAQRLRWARARKESQSALMGVAKTTVPSPVKRTMSAAARRRISAFQRARWAKLRAGQKKAA